MLVAVYKSLTIRQDVLIISIVALVNMKSMYASSGIYIIENLAGHNGHLSGSSSRS